MASKPQPLNCLEMYSMFTIEVRLPTDWGESLGKGPFGDQRLPYFKSSLSDGLEKGSRASSFGVGREFIYY